MVKPGWLHDEGLAGAGIRREKSHGSGKKWGQNAVEGHGLPLAAAVSGANVHDGKLLEKTLDNLVVFRPPPSEESPQNLCLDAGYTGWDEAVISRHYIPHIRPRAEEKQLIEHNPNFKARVRICWLG